MNAKAGEASYDADFVRWAYRLLLEREPESEHVLEECQLAFKSLKNLREHFLSSVEYSQKTPNPVSIRRSLALQSPSRIDLKLKPEEVEALLKRVEKSWESLGESDPHWSVLTDEQYRSGNIEESKVRFYESGQEHCDLLKATLLRNRRDPNAYESILEYGCGVGRVSHWFSKEFHTAHCCDVSSEHLRLAQEYIACQGIENVQFHKISSISDLAGLPNVDLVMSYLVLQHNPPPVIEALIDGLLALLRPGGAALFQVPVFLEHYSFIAADYVKEPLKLDDVEMHAVPHWRIFELIEERGCRVLEVIDDALVERDFGVSNTFLIERK